MTPDPAAISDAVTDGSLAVEGAVAAVAAWRTEAHEVTETARLLADAGDPVAAAEHLERADLRNAEAQTLSATSDARRERGVPDDVGLGWPAWLADWFSHESPVDPVDAETGFAMVDAAVDCWSRASEIGETLQRHRSAYAEMRTACAGDPELLAELDAMEAHSAKGGAIRALTDSRRVDLETARAWRRHARRLAPVARVIAPATAMTGKPRPRGAGRPAARPAARRAGGERSGSDPGDGLPDEPPAPPLRLWRHPRLGLVNAKLWRMLYRLGGLPL